MIHFAWPWLFLALPLPWLARRLLPPARAAGAVLRVPFLDDFADAPAAQRPAAGRAALFVAACAWLLLVTAAARPEWLGEPLELPQSGRDLLLAVDLSGSMDTRDFQRQGQVIDRLTATKQVAADFIERRAGDRIGLILFGRNAYLQAPLTFDRATVRTLLDEAVLGLAGKETAIGDAIGLAVKRLRDGPAASRVVVLLTDGANTAGEVEPLTAARLAADAGLTIHTIGIGADEMVVESLFGRRRVNPSADLDEKALRAIAESTGGHYFRARDLDELEQVYRLLDQIEPIEQARQVFRPTTSLYPWPLAGALLLALALLWHLRRAT